MVVAMRKGWFIIPGVQDGDRTFEDQAQGLIPAFEECSGKSVIDLGCAEGLIAHEFCRRGASRVVALDSVIDHLMVAQKVGKGLKIEYRQAYLDDYIHQHQTPAADERYDIVAALGVTHKLWKPKAALRWICASAKDLVLMRTSRRYDNDLIVSKRDNSIQCRVSPVMNAEGFVLEKTVQGSRKFMEDVQYWRRVK